MNSIIGSLISRIGQKNKQFPLIIDTFYVCPPALDVHYPLSGFINSLNKEKTP